MPAALRRAIMMLGLYGPDSPHYRRARRVLRREAWLLVAEAESADPPTPIAGG
jgi:hypothetical protein